MRESVTVPDLPDDEGITGFLAGIAGGLWWGSHRPPPPGIPTMRMWQRESALVHLDWLRDRLS
jgi:hypothetical protein